MNMEQRSAAERAKYPSPDGDAVAHLRHTLAVYAGEPDGDMAIMATSGIYGKGVQTGLTWGDLREIAARLGDVVADEHPNADGED